MPIDGFDFGDFLGIALGAAEEISIDMHEHSKALRKHGDSSVMADLEMTEDEALSLFDAAEALGIGREVDLEESAEIRYQRAKEESLLMAGDLIEDEQLGDIDNPLSLKDRKLRQKDSRYSSLTGKPKCAFEQWMKDVCAGRKTIYDPVGGANSYGKSKR
jgi:hypothetical protein